MKKIYSNMDPSILLHIINKQKDLEEGRTDIAPEDQFLQVAALRMNEGKTFKAHKHLWKEGEERVIAQESWVVLSGSVAVTLYDLDDSIVSEEVLDPGDLSMTFQGGHNYVAILPDTFVYEFKTGPYKGQKQDKEFIK